MPIRNKIVETARTWIGVPWRHQGRTRHGVDCVGLVAQVGKELGLTNYDFLGYARRSGGLELAEHFRKVMRSKPLNGMQPGDVLVFRDKAYPCHVAIASERYGVVYMIHAFAPRRQVLEEAFDNEWRSKAVFCFEFAEM